MAYILENRIISLVGFSLAIATLHDFFLNIGRFL